MGVPAKVIGRNTETDPGQSVDHGLQKVNTYKDAKATSTKTWHDLWVRRCIA